MYIVWTNRQACKSIFRMNMSAGWILISCVRKCGYSVHFCIRDAHVPLSTCLSYYVSTSLVVSQGRNLTNQYVLGREPGLKCFTLVSTPTYSVCILLENYTIINTQSNNTDDSLTGEIKLVREIKRFYHITVIFECRNSTEKSLKTTMFSRLTFK